MRESINRSVKQREPPFIEPLLWAEHLSRVTNINCSQGESHAIFLYLFKPDIIQSEPHSKPSRKQGYQEVELAVIDLALPSIIFKPPLFSFWGPGKPQLTSVVGLPCRGEGTTGRCAHMEPGLGVLSPWSLRSNSLRKSLLPTPSQSGFKFRP